MCIPSCHQNSLSAVLFNQLFACIGLQLHKATVRVGLPTQWRKVSQRCCDQVQNYDVSLSLHNNKHACIELRQEVSKILEVDMECFFFLFSFFFLSAPSGASDTHTTLSSIAFTTRLVVYVNPGLNSRYISYQTLS